MIGSDAQAVLQRALAKLSGAEGEEAFVDMCAKSKNRAREPACLKWKLSYEEYFALREHVAPRVVAKWRQAGYRGNFAASSLPPGDRE